MKMILIYSGGLDSTVLLHHLVNQNHEVHALTFIYGQTHAREIHAAEHFAQRLRVPHVIERLTLPGTSALQGGCTIPDGHYEAETMRATVVPGRNLVMLSHALAHAAALGADLVSFAAHAGDHAIYPDCRTEFLCCMDQVAQVYHYECVRLDAPFIKLRKEDIVRRGFSMDIELERTWSCYKGGELHCGTCGTCVERREAFQLAGVPDLTTYEG